MEMAFSDWRGVESKESTFSSITRSGGSLRLSLLTIPCSPLFRTEVVTRLLN